MAQLTAALQQRDERITALDARLQARQHTTSDCSIGCCVACSAVHKQWQDSEQCTAATFACDEVASLVCHFGVHGGVQDLLARGMKNCNVIRPARPLAERTPNSMPRPAFA